MKINSIQRDITLKAASSGLYSEAPNHREKSIAGMCKINKGYNADNCGSFTGKSETATSFLDKILKSNWFGKFTKYSSDHNISTSALIALVLAGIMRPAAIMALPGDKDKEDKIYASGHAMASGIIGFIFSTAVTMPLDEAVNKMFGKNGEKFARKNKTFQKMSKEIADLEVLEKAKTISEENAKKLKNLRAKKGALRTLVKNIPDWLIGVPRAMLTIALIPPILKYVFGVEKKKKPAEQSQVLANSQEQAKIETQTVKLDEKPVFAAFKGGVK
ncbi:hypothetical protein J6P92_07400 [bacterium]|nr:hypothetical protein [bacterium]